MAAVEDPSHENKLESAEQPGEEAAQEETTTLEQAPLEPLKDPNSLEEPLNMSNEDQSLNSTLTYTTAFDDNNESTGPLTIATSSTSALSGLPSGGGGSVSAGEDKIEAVSKQLAQSTLDGSLNEHLSNQSDENSDVYKDTRESLERDSTTNTEADAAPASFGKNGGGGGASESDADDDEDDDDDPSKYEDSRQPEDSVHESSPDKNAGDDARSDDSYDDQDDADDENESGLPEESAKEKEEPAAELKSAEAGSKPRRLKHQSTNGSSSSSANIDPTTIPSVKKGGFFQHDDREDENESPAASAEKAPAGGEENAEPEEVAKKETPAAEPKSKSGEKQSASSERWQHDKFDSKREGAKKTKQPRTREKKPREEGDEKAPEDEQAGGYVPRSQAKPKSQRPPREPREPRDAADAKEKSTSTDRPDSKNESPAQHPPRASGPRGPKKNNKPRRDEKDVSLSEYIESTESVGDKTNQNRKRQDRNKPDSRRNSDSNEVQQRPRDANRFNPSQNDARRDDAAVRPKSGRRRSDNDVINERQGPREPQRKAFTEKKRDGPRSNHTGGLNPDLRKRLDFSTRVTTYDDEGEYGDDGYDGMSNLEPVSLKITVNRNATRRTVKTGEPDDTAELVIATPREGNGGFERGPRRGPNANIGANRFKPSQGDAHGGGQMRKPDRFNERGNPRSSIGHQELANNQTQEIGYFGDNFEQAHDHRHAPDQQRPRGQPRGQKMGHAQQEAGNNFSDYMQFSAASSNSAAATSSFDNRMPFIKTQSFSNSKLRNRNSANNAPSASQNFGDYQQHHVTQQQQQQQQHVAPQHELVNQLAANLDFHDPHQQFGMFQSHGGYRGGLPERQMTRSSNQEQQLFHSNAAFEAHRLFSQQANQQQQQQQQFHSMNKGPDFNQFADNSNHFHHYNDHAHGGHI